MAIDLRTNIVNADMDRIFKPIAEHTPGNCLSFKHGVRRENSRRKRNWHRLTLASPALVLLATTWVAISYIRAGDKPPLAASAPIGTAASTPDIQPFKPMTPTPAVKMSDVVPLVARNALQSSTGNGSKVPESRISIDGPPGQRVTVAAHKATSPTLAFSQETMPRQRLLDKSRTTLSTTPSVSDRTDQKGVPSLPPCFQGSLEDRCIYKEVLAADARLRRAYNGAMQRGISDRYLTTVNHRWRQAREYSDEDPDETIQRYDRLTNALEEARSKDVE